jgi:hypothetical protein
MLEAVHMFIQESWSWQAVGCGDKEVRKYLQCATQPSPRGALQGSHRRGGSAAVARAR